MQIPSMPFKVLALAPFRAANKATWLKAPIPVDKNDLDIVIKDLDLMLYVQLPDNLCPEGGIDIKISGFKDFHPDKLVQNNDFLKNLMDASAFIQKATAQGKSIQEIGDRIKNWPNLPPITIETKRPKPQKASKDAVDNILSMVALPDEQPGASPQEQSMSTQIDAILQKTLSIIFSDNRFRRLEAVWRGVKLFMHQGCVNGDVKLEIVPVSLETLNDTLDSLTATLIQDLPSIIIVDLPFDNSAISLEHLEKIAVFSETLMVPSICWITKDFLYIDSWKDFNKLPFLPNHLDGSHYAKWHRLEQSSAGMWMAVTCNRLLSRYPYGKDNKTKSKFKENSRLWTGPVWAAGSLLAQSFAKTGWPTRFTDRQNITIEDLPLNTEDPNNQIPAETSFSTDRIDQFTRIGIIPLTCTQNKDTVFTTAGKTVAGNSLGFQALLSTVTKFVFWCLDNLSKDLDQKEIEENFTRAFTLFWEQSGHQVPEDLAISAGSPNPESRIPLKIELTPSSKILPSGEKIELEFTW
jgi:type VI secretion system protein ImpC